MTSTKKSQLIKTVSMIPAIFLIVLCFLFGAVSLGEGYNVFNPYADTEFAKDYTPEKFKQISVGMTRNEVRNIIGDPMSSWSDTTKNMFMDTYTRDGYLLRKGGFSLVSDQAWYGSSVEYNKDSIAVKVYAGWYYD
jgi:hypothetical protein